LSLFYGNRRAHLSIDAAGNVIRRAMIDFGQAVSEKGLSFSSNEHRNAGLTTDGVYAHRNA
jgi:hypothetical protein